MKRALILSGGGSRGSFQIGVWRYLQEKNWCPDMICGTSIGAINAVAIGSGLTFEETREIWIKSGRKNIYRLQIAKFIANALFRRRLAPLMDTAPLKEMLLASIDFNRLKRSRTEIVISAVNMHTALPEFFNQNEITIDHLMASSAMPIIFPPHKIDGTLYWDGGIMANVPLLPALVRGMDEIIVVLLSPVGHLSALPEPKGVMDAGEHLMEHSLISSYQSTIMGYFMDGGNPGVNDLLPGSLYLRRKELLSDNTSNTMVKNSRRKTPRIITIAPSRMLGIPSLLNFSLKQANELMDDGYKSASNQLKNIL